MIKRLVWLIFIFLGCYYIYDNNLFNSQQLLLDLTKTNKLQEKNTYYLENKDYFFKEVTDFKPKNKDDLLNIYYTAINSGWDYFIFYCDYEKCLDDVTSLSENQDLLSHINSFVHPFNSFQSLTTYTYPLLNKKVEIKVDKIYSQTEIDKINEEINKIYQDLKIDKIDNKREQIKIVHDYIINQTKYDYHKISNLDDQTYQSNKATGLLFEHYAVCSGYSDTMALFLNNFNIPNIKVTSDNHVWNLVYLNDKWLHLDLTWDDPYDEKGIDQLNYFFFLKDYKELKKWETSEHIFNEDIYKEGTN